MNASTRATASASASASGNQRGGRQCAPQVGEQTDVTVSQGDPAHTASSCHHQQPAERRARERVMQGIGVMRRCRSPRSGRLGIPFWRQSGHAAKRTVKMRRAVACARRQFLQSRRDVHARARDRPRPRRRRWDRPVPLPADGSACRHESRRFPRRQAPRKPRCSRQAAGATDRKGGSTRRWCGRRRRRRHRRVRRVVQWPASGPRGW